MKHLRFRELGQKLPPPGWQYFQRIFNALGLPFSGSVDPILTIWNFGENLHVPAQLADGDIICDESHGPCLCLQRGGSFKNNLSTNTFGEEQAIHIKLLVT